MYTRLLTFLFALSLSGCSQGQPEIFMRTMMWGSQLDISWLCISGNKIVSNPRYGANPLQLDREMRDNAKNVATFTKNGNKMNLKWGDGRVQTVNVEYKNGVLSAFDGGLCSKAKPFTSKTFSDKTYSGLAVVGNVSRSVTLFLGKDGRFSEGRIGAVSGDGVVTSGVAASSSKSSGTYTITGNTVVFKYADGREWRTMGQPYDLGREEIILGDQLFKLQ
jgi:hypothetical protein